MNCESKKADANVIALHRDGDDLDPELSMTEAEIEHRRGEIKKRRGELFGPLALRNVVRMTVPTNVIPFTSERSRL